MGDFNQRLSVPSRQQTSSLTLLQKKHLDLTSDLPKPIVEGRMSKMVRPTAIG